MNIKDMIIERENTIKTLEEQLNKNKVELNLLKTMYKNYEENLSEQFLTLGDFVSHVAREYGYNDSSIGLKLGFSENAVYQWKNNSFPKPSSLNKLVNGIQELSNGKYSVQMITKSISEWQMRIAK